jgi:hypothetical protein
MKNKFFKITSVIGGIIYFIVLLSTESQNVNIQNHDFEAQLKTEKQQFEEFQIQPVIQEPMTVFDPHGELFKTFEETKFNIVQKNLIQGSLYWDTQWRETSDQIEIQTPFQFENQKFDTGYIKIGSLLIHNPKSKVLIQHEDNRITITNTGNAIELYFEGLLEAFVIPSQMEVSIHQSLLNERNSVLFYSKLKKLFALRNHNTENEKLKEGMRISSQRTEEIKKAIELSQQGRLFFAEKPITKIIKNIQANAIGISQTKKDKRNFSLLVEPLFQAIENLKQNEFVEMEESLNIFEKNYTSSEWDRILNENQDIHNKWQDYLAVHWIWLQTITLNDPAYRFVLLWDNPEQTIFEKIEHRISETETLIAQQNNTQAQTMLDEIHTILDEEVFLNDTNIEFRLSRARRIITEILKRQEAFQTQENFELQRKLIEQEIRKQTNIEKKNELTLENSKYIMELIQQLVQSQTRPNDQSLESILGTYRMLKVDQVEKTLNVQIFSAEEKKLIQIIGTIGNQRITTQTLERIQRDLQEKAEEQRQIINLQPEQEIDKPIITDPYHIQNEQKLLEFFESNNWNIENRNISTNEIYSTFENITQGEIILNGIFYYNLQIFNPVYENGQTIEIRAGNTSISPEMLVKKWQNDAQRQNTAQEVVEQNTIPQNSQKAQQKKYIIQEILNIHGFKINKSNVEIMNQEMTIFEITEADLTDNIMSSFTYSEKEKKIQNIELQDGRQTKEIPYSLEIENAKKILDLQAKSWIQEKMRTVR